MDRGLWLGVMTHPCDPSPPPPGRKQQEGHECRVNLGSMERPCLRGAGSKAGLGLPLRHKWYGEVL